MPDFLYFLMKILNLSIRKKREGLMSIDEFQILSFGEKKYRELPFNLNAIEPEFTNSNQYYVDIIV